MQYYQDIITIKSFKILQDLKRSYDFILIGGWAVFLHTNKLKSKDIDIVIDYDELEKLRKKFTLSKNQRLKKYEIQMDQTDIDIYLPHYSDLKIPLEEIKEYTQSMEGFVTLKPEILLILKQTAFLNRQGSAKGEKDKIDIISLLNLDNFDFKVYQTILQRYDLMNYQKELIDLVSGINELQELELNQYQYSKLKKRILKLFA
ncbi:hypothetical protein KKC16_01740 [Patescibacteria group bacterium]|nr:hypothetical protein [Patescibacteria group bacterium]MBU4482151.1 hypothetical protein [Patescibacteria group bacterium]